MELGTPELATLLLQHLPDYVVLLDADGRYQWVNRLDPTLSHEDVIGRPVEAFVSEVDKPLVRDSIARVLRTGEPTYYEILSYGQGEYATYYGCRAVPAPPGPDGRPRVMVLSSDVTARRRAEKALAHSEARFRSLVETLPQWVMLIGEDLVITYVNRDPSPGSGLRADELVGMQVGELSAPADRARILATIAGVFETGQPSRYETSGRYDERHYHVEVVPLGADVLLVATDVTDTRRTERQREAMVAELDHRVKNTLATVLAIAQQTAARADSVERFCETFIGRLESMARTHEILAASSWSSVRLSELVERVLGPLVGRELELETQAGDPELPPEVSAPLSLALHELGTNAVKHGALSRSEGALELVSHIDERGSVLVWTERVAEDLAQPLTEGYGLGLVRGIIEHELGGAFTTRVEGRSLTHRLSIPLPTGRP